MTKMMLMMLMMLMMMGEITIIIIMILMVGECVVTGEDWITTLQPHYEDAPPPYY